MYSVRIKIFPQTLASVDKFIDELGGTLSRKEALQLIVEDWIFRYGHKPDTDFDKSKL